MATQDVASSTIGGLSFRYYVAANGVLMPQVQVVPSTDTSSAPSNSTSTALEASRVVKASAGVVYGLSGFNNKSSSQYIQIFDNSSLPADSAGTLIFPFQVAAASPFALDFGSRGRAFSVGIVICNSSTLSTKTIGSADVWFDIQYA